MDRSEFNYELPEALIAQEPLPQRSASRLLVLDGVTGEVQDRQFPDLVHLLDAGDLLVLNDTRVLPARLRGRKVTGGRVELLLERLTGPRNALAQLRASRGPPIGSEILFPGETTARIAGKSKDLYELAFDCDVRPYLERLGEVPLPPYIRRSPRARDKERYQTVFSRKPGAVAAPTAGLHFDESLLRELDRRGVKRGYLTLHVGAGTFAPVRCRRIEEHRLHAESLEIDERLCQQITDARGRGNRVVAVGTTTVRALEAAASGGEVTPFTGETSLFIYPGFRFRVVDKLLTNFHLPESSLLILVAAFAGLDHTLAAYRHAVTQRYRFFSYGDAMFVTPRPNSRAE